jgi:hypothetical protein
MTKRDLLQDSNLSEVAFGSNGQELFLTFLSMEDGREVARLRCHGLLVVKYHSVSSPLPLYVGEVTHEKIDVQNSTLRLASLDYGFTNQDSRSLHPNSEGIHFVHIEGGELDIDIACADVEFCRSE